MPFRFEVGGLRLFSLNLPLVVLELEPGAALPDGWFENLAAVDGADGYLIRGVPLASAALRDTRVRVLRNYPRHLVDLTTGYDAYMAKFSGKTRSTLKRKLRRFQDLSHGTIAWKEFRSTDELNQFLPIARELSAKTYQERLLDAGLPASQAFTAEALSRAERGAVRAYILYLNEKPVSYLYLPIDGRRVIYAYLGYDPACAEHSPGTVLQLLAMERLFADPALELFDFTEGAGKHKALFATHAVDCADIAILRPVLRPNAVVRTHQWLGRVETLAATALDRLGLKQQIKKWIRSRAG